MTFSPCMTWMHGARGSTLSLICKGLGLTDRPPSSRGLFGGRRETFTGLGATRGFASAKSDLVFRRFSGGPSMTSAAFNSVCSRLHIHINNRGNMHQVRQCRGLGKHQLETPRPRFLSPVAKS